MGRRWKVAHIYGQTSHRLQMREGSKAWTPTTLQGEHVITDKGGGLMKRQGWRHGQKSRERYQLGYQMETYALHTPVQKVAVTHLQAAFQVSYNEKRFEGSEMVHSYAERNE